MSRSLNAALPFIVVGAIWEIVAHAGVFPPRLFPPLEEVAATLARLTAAGILPHHAVQTLFRLAAGFAIARRARRGARRRDGALPARRGPAE